LAFAAWFAFAEPRSRVQIDAGPAGIVVSTGAQDMGNGTRSILARAVADELGVPPAQVIVRVGDSNFVHGPFSAGSRTTSSLVPACVHACAQLKEELVELAERHFGLVRAGAGPGGVEHADGILPWTKVLEVIRPVRVIGRRKRDKGGYVLPPIAGLVIEKYISSSIQIVSLTVDTRLGRVQLEEAWAGFGVGRLITPELAVSQAKGGILQGLSYALYEERRLDPKDGFLLSAGLEDYRIMGIGDVPRIHVHFDERGYEKTRAQAVGLGELVTLAPAAAVGNAVFDATGWRPRDLPLRPDRVLQGVRG
jgi:xanthine dehydrogenase YagR molybdenum-binding subunit